MKYITLDHALGNSLFYYREGTSDEHVMQQIFVNQDYSLSRLPLHAQINEYAKARMIRGMRPLIVDLGANIGASAMFFMLTYPDARVVAVEPDKENCELLSRNTSGFDCICVEGVIASGKGRANLVDPGIGSWGFRTEIDGGGKLETFTVPELIEQHGGEQFFPFIVKIDIEGAESELFSKNYDWIDSFPILIIELHDWLLPGTNNARNFLQCIAGRARDFVHIGENVFSLRTPLDGHPIPSPAGSSVSTAAI